MDTQLVLQYYESDMQYGVLIYVDLIYNFTIINWSSAIT